MTALHERMRRELSAMAEHSVRRELRFANGIDCSSNDYLGLGRHPDVLVAVTDAILRGVPIGSGGSRLLSGNHPEHVAAETAFASFAGRERALLLGSGFAANHALLSALPSRRDLIVLDSGAHASLKEGARASMASRRMFRHNDPADLRRALHGRERFDRVFVVVEGVHSMDGDRAPLRQLGDIAAEFECEIIVDEAHATGLIGRHLRGAHDEPDIPRPLATVHPCGKAIGLGGAFIAADALVIDYLVNTARAFIFSTSPSPLQAVALRTAVELLPSQRDRAAELAQGADELRRRLGALRRWNVPRHGGPVIPVFVGDARGAAWASAWLIGHTGFDIRAIRPPTVPAGTSRLRISLTLDRCTDVASLADAIVAAERAFEEEQR